jgi:hypothetical protein
MQTLKISLLAGSLVLAASSAFAQTIAPNYGVNENAVRAAAEQNGSNAYASAEPRQNVRSARHLRVNRPAIEHGTNSDAGAK